MTTNGYETENDIGRVPVNGQHLSAQYESETVGTVRAGHLVEETANGVQPLSLDGVRPNKVFIALDLPGRGYSHGDAFPEGETIEYAELAGGTVRGLLATGSSVALTDELTPAGDGTVRAMTGDGSDEAVAQVPAQEPANKSRAVDNTGGSEAVQVYMEASN